MDNEDAKRPTTIIDPLIFRRICTPFAGDDSNRF
jgi:hypothetical protein